MYTSNPQLGKYEGERSQLLSQIVYESTLDGGADMEWDFGSDGYVDYNALIKGKRYSFMVHADDVGFVYVETFDSRDPEEVRLLSVITESLDNYDPE